MADEVNINLSLCPNNTYGLYETMRSLNEIIDALWKLSDTDYYLSYVFNGSTDSDEMIKNIFNEDDLMELANKFEHIRAIVLSEVLQDCSMNFRNIEHAILQSVWEQEYPNNWDERKIKHEKSKVINSYSNFVNSATNLKEYYQTRYGEEMEENGNKEEAQK